MANHKSAKKRSRQNSRKNLINVKIMAKLKTSIKRFNELLQEKNKEEISKSLESVNSFLAKAAKKGIIKKQFVSRKLSSLSKKIKNI